MFCPNCQTQFPGSGKYCEKCGAALPHAEGGALRMNCSPRLLKCGKPFADYGFTTFQQPLLLLRR